MPNAKVSLDESVNKFLEEGHKDWLADMIKFVIQMIMEF